MTDPYIKPKHAVLYGAGADAHHRISLRRADVTYIKYPEPSTDLDDDDTVLVHMRDGHTHTISLSRSGFDQADEGTGRDSDLDDFERFIFED